MLTETKTRNNMQKQNALNIFRQHKELDRHKAQKEQSKQ